MIYLNNAATSYPKPQCVLEAHAAALCHPPAAQFRSAEQGSREDLWDACQKMMGRILGIANHERIRFTSGATQSINAVLAGLDLENGHIITTVTEHNSVLRPLYNLPQLSGCEISLAACGNHGRVNPADLEALIRNNTRLIIVNHCSNVTGMVQDVRAIGAIARHHGILMMIDVSQSAGCLSLAGDEWQADIMIFTGHKSLLGVQGTGGYYVRKGIELRPYIFGGTGRDSTEIIYTKGNYEYDAGTQNMPGLAALKAGGEYLLEQGIEQVYRHERMLMERLYSALRGMISITVYGTVKTNMGPLLSFNIKGLEPSDTAYILQNGYGITVRTGLHCAPLIHSYLGSGEKGTVRISVSGFNTIEDIDTLVDALSQLDRR